MISSLIPTQQTGVEKNFLHHRTFLTEAAARAQFEIAKIRLTHVSSWHRLAGDISAVFFLFDQNELLLNRPVQQGDYIRISIPGPRGKAGDGYDWAFVEALKHSESAAAMRVRPTEKPSGTAVAHFLSSEATSTFAVWLEGLKVYSGIFGRNESPNLEETNKLLDQLRNLVVGLVAEAGASDIQWTSLAKGLIED